ncbi:hypothetical protein BK745P1_00027 [Bacteroides phage BK745P1]|nr:hypothetical protein BK745P1_00027 [Bacteroides phage BK745P1]
MIFFNLELIGKRVFIVDIVDVGLKRPVRRGFGCQRQFW